MRTREPADYRNAPPVVAPVEAEVFRSVEVSSSEYIDEEGSFRQSTDYDGTDVETADSTTGYRIEADGKIDAQDIRARGSIKVGEGYIISDTGFYLPVDYSYGVGTPTPPGSAREPVGVSFISTIDDEVVGQLSADEYTALQDGDFDDAADYRRLVLYSVSSISVQADDVWFGRTDPVEVFGIPHTEVTQVTGTGTTTTSASFVNLNPRCRVLAFHKKRADTKLVFQYQGTILNNNSLGQYEVGVNVDGVNYAVANYFSDRMPGGARSVSGLAAGFYDVELRMRRVNATGNVVQANGGFVSLQVTETF